MSTTGVNASTSSSSSTSSTSTAAATASSNEFLNILLTELKNQDPIDPVSTTDFTTQLAQYSSLEQQIDTNNNLTTLISDISGTSLGNLSATSYLGNTVDVNSATTVVQNGTATWTYSSPSAVSAVTITVTDASGNTVYTGAGDTSSGTHTFSLSAGTTDADGTPLTISVAPTDSTGGALTPTVASRVTIDAVDSSTGTMMLDASGYAYAASSVVRIAPTPASTTSSTSSSNTSSSTGSSS